MKEYLIERDKILANIEKLTLEEIVQYCKKWSLPMPMPLFSNEEYVKASLHKARLDMTKLEGVSDEELKKLQDKSRKALKKLGWSCSVFRSKENIKGEYMSLDTTYRVHMYKEYQQRVQRALMVISAYLMENDISMETRKALNEVLHRLKGDKE